MTVPVTREGPPQPDDAPLRILLGECYRHVPTNELVEVVDFEYRRTKKTPKHSTARTGRVVVRRRVAPWDSFLTIPADLQPLDLPPQTSRHLTIPGAPMLDDKDLKDLPQLDNKTRIRDRPSPAPHAPPILGQLKVTRCPDVTQVGRVWPLRGETTMLGRDPDNLVALNDPDVSRHHARIDVREAQHIIVDLESTNGLVVNGQKVKESPLRIGDTILLGSTALVYAGP